MKKKIRLFNVQEEEIIKTLDEQRFKRVDNSYDYLLNLNVRTFTKEKCESLKREIMITREKISKLKQTSESGMWIEDLNKLSEKL